MISSPLHPSRLALVVVLVLTATATAGSAGAATFTVDRVDDDRTATACDDATAADCSLRGAVLAANALDEASTIVVPAGHYVLTDTAGCAFHGSKDPNDVIPVGTIGMCLTRDITLVGAGAADTVIDANQTAGQFGVMNPALFIDAFATVSLRALTITKGNFNVGAGFGHGGGIHNSGTLTLTDCILTANYSGGFGGGALYNQGGVVTLVRTTVSQNITTGTGGGLNNSYGTIAVIDSLVVGNQASIGGGIGNFAGEVTVTGSTLTANVADMGGGAANSDFDTMILTNTTVSENEGRLGGGIMNANAGILSLFNVTVTNNSATGVGGGLASGDGATLTVGNSIIAGNTVNQQNLDCNTARGAIDSLGHNLIQDTTQCAITGDTTSNVIGQDAKLDALGNNGGPTPTHALLPGSPALDAGNPAAPGSGGAACTALDQRGQPRPSGSACDIGAFESSGALALASVTPPRGGDTGLVTVRLLGSGVQDGATVHLARAGETDVPASAVAVSGGGDVVAATFDLAGRATGAWDVVVVDPDDATATLPAAFVVEPGTAPDLWLSLTGPNALRFRNEGGTGVADHFFLYFGNRGNVDAFAVPITLSLPAPLTWALRFRIDPPPTQPEQPLDDWSHVRLETGPDAYAGGISTIPLLLPVVPAGFTGVLEFTLRPPAPTEGESDLFAIIGDPLWHAGNDAASVASFATSASAWVHDFLGVDLPATFPPLDAYVARQLEAVVEQGRAALNASVGGLVPTYSVTALQADFGLVALRTFLQPPASDVVSAVELRAWAAALVAGGWRDRVAAFFVGTAAAGQNCKPKDPSQVQGEGCFINVKDKVGPPPLPLPPGCSPQEINEQLSTLSGTVKLLLSPPECPFPPTVCDSLPDRHVLHTANGDFCVPDNPPPNCENPATTLNVPSNGILKCQVYPIKRVSAFDPNDKLGTLGTTAAHAIPPATALDYLVRFENLPAASAAAQQVVVTDQLDPTKVDLDTFSLGPITIGATTLLPAPNVQQYSGGIDLRPAQNLLATVDAALDKATGLVTWTYRSIDPETLQLTTDPLAGIIPPDVTAPEGEGSAAFTVHPVRGLADGTQICNQAVIVFDANAPIPTPPWCNLVDASAPTSAVAALPATTAAGGFALTWNGSDGGAGIADYTIYVSTDGGPYVPLLTHTAATTVPFDGEVGKAYAFYSVARDLAGNEEAAPAAFDARTVVVGPAGPDDLAITKITAPKTVTLKAAKAPPVRPIAIRVQNRSPHPETIADGSTLAGLVHLTLESLGACTVPSTTLRMPKKFPLVVKPKKSLVVTYDATFACANHPAKSTKQNPDERDYRVAAVVDVTVLGAGDAHPADDACPRTVAPPGAVDAFPDGSIHDKGCGTKKADKTFGDPILVDVVVK